jgi:3-hydroxyisobutyrate dehydrogenase-like beta-hydroxyacid dehydrogenase
VSGGVKGAAAGTLTLMISGPAAATTRVQPLLAALGRVIIVGEKPGLGQTLKLANNLMSAASLAIASEAMAMGVKAGLDPGVMLEVINASSGRNSATQDKIPRHVLNRKFDFGFANALSFKDVRLCLEEAEALGVPMVVGAAVRQMLSITQQVCGPDADVTDMIRIHENWAGCQIGHAEEKQ